MLIYAAMVVVALQSMSPSRQGIHVEAYCARLVVEGCDVPMHLCRITVAVNSRIGCHTKKIVPDLTHT